MRRPVLAIAFTVAAVAGALLCATSSSATDAASAPVTRASVVRLPTGDTIRISSSGGRDQIGVVAAEPGGITGQFAQFAGGGHEYVFPAEVRPLLSVLDRSLFDVTSLAAAGDDASIPVSLTLAHGARPSVPGLTITSRTATSAQGYLAPSAQFRAALVRAATATLQPGGDAPTSLFGGVTRLAATGAQPARVQPKYPQVTLVIKVVGANGQSTPGGFLGLINTDNSKRYINFVSYVAGEARVSVPYGHYSAITDVPSFSGNSFTDRILPVADFTVTANLQTMTIDAADATASPSVTVPRPADVLTKSVEFDRESRLGGSLGASYSFGGHDHVLVAPTPQAQVGTLHWIAGWTLVHRSATSPYSYDLSFLDNGSVPADQARVVRDFQLATVTSRYYNDRKRDSQFVRASVYPFQFGYFAFFLPLATPVVRTEYVYGDPTALWSAALIADPTATNPFGGFVQDDFRVYPQGADLAVDWLRGPLAPKPPEQTSGDLFYVCPVCRSTHRMSVLLAPFADTTPGHFGDVTDPQGGPATTFALYRGSTRLAAGHDLIGARVSVPPGPGSYRLRLAVDRSADRSLTSTSTLTSLTFGSAAGHGAPLPSGWSCDDATSGCTVLPILTAQVPLPTDLSDRLPVGDSTFVLTIAPFHGAAPVSITSAQLLTQVGTAPFRAAHLERIANGRYRVTLHNPTSSAGQGVTLRVIAADDAGDSITQTTTDAYLVAAQERTETR